VWETRPGAQLEAPREPPSPLAADEHDVLGPNVSAYASCMSSLAPWTRIAQREFATSPPNASSPRHRPTRVRHVAAQRKLAAPPHHRLTHVLQLPNMSSLCHRSMQLTTSPPGQVEPGRRRFHGHQRVRWHFTHTPSRFLDSSLAIDYLPHNCRILSW